MAELKVKDVGMDLSVVVNFECGCFVKLYYELEKLSAGWIDRDVDYCSKAHAPAAFEKAVALAAEEVKKVKQ